MKKAFAKIPGTYKKEDLEEGQICDYDDWDNPVVVEVFAIIVRHDEQLIGLHKHEDADYWPMTLEQFQDEDPDYMEIFISDNFHSISSDDYKYNYVWSIIVDDEYEIRDGLNNDNVVNMKGEIEI